jgi:hypothetical protein
MAGTEPHNMRAAEIFAKLSGLYQEVTNVNIDNRQQTVNVLSIQELINEKLLTNDEQPKDAIIKSDDEFNYRMFKEELESTQDENKKD